MTRTGQLARLTSLALATGTLVMSTGLSPAAAAETTTSQVVAAGDGAALILTINLPAQLAGSPFGRTIVQTVSLTDGSVSTLSGPLASTTAVLGKGNTPVLSELLSLSTSAVLTGQREQSSSARDIDQSGLRLSLLPLTSKVADPSLDGVLAHSSSGVARLGIAGLDVPQLSLVTAPVVDLLETAIGTAAPGVTEATGTVTGTLNQAIDTLNAATDDAAAPLTAPVQAAVDTAVATLTETLADLTGTVGLLSSATDLISLESIVSEQVISRDGNAVTSTVTNGVKSINVLNGLVRIKAVESAATAVAGGAPGTGSATTVAPVLDISLADGALEAVLDQTGLNVGGTVGDALPPALAGTVNTALDAVNDLLAGAVGLDVAIGKGVTTVSPDGTASAAAVGATTVTINPLGIAELLPAGETFMTLQLVSANATAASQVVPLAAPSVPTAVTLPRTGAALPLTGAVATLLIGSALVARRRQAVIG